MAQVFTLTQSNEKVIERVIIDENVHYNHMVLPKGEGLPPHTTNSNVYMTVLRGKLTIALGDEEAKEYPAGTILKIPNRVPMRAYNLYDETLEITVVKAPAPR